MDNVIFRIISYNSPEYRASVVLCTEILLKPLGLKYTLKTLQNEKDNIYNGHLESKIPCSH